jgi:hypothetical protein
VLLYGQQLSRVAAMTRSQVCDRGDSLSIRFGTGDVEIAEPLAGFLARTLTHPAGTPASPRPPTAPGCSPDTYPVDRSPRHG